VCNKVYTTASEDHLTAESGNYTSECLPIYTAGLQTIGMTDFLLPSANDNPWICDYHWWANVAQGSLASGVTGAIYYKFFTKDVTTGHTWSDPITLGIGAYTDTVTQISGNGYFLWNDLVNYLSAGDHIQAWLEMYSNSNDSSVDALIDAWKIDVNCHATLAF